jgi:type IV secretion system protein VirB6
MSGTNATSAALIGWVAPVLKYGIILYFVGRMIASAIRHEGEPLSEMEGQMIKAALALYLAANLAGYNQYVRDLLLTDLPTEITSRIAAVFGGNAITTSIFDKAWNMAFVAGLKALKSLSFWDGAAAAGIAVVAVCFLVAAALALAVMFVIWLLSFIFLALLIAVGPLFVGLFFFPLLRGVFDGWLGSVLTNIILQIFVATMLAILLTAEVKALDQIINTHVATAGDEMGQIEVLIGGIILFAICACAAWQLPGLAARIGGGVVTDVGIASRWVYGAAGGALGWAGAKLGAIGQRPASPEEAQQNVVRNTPPGRSLSDS